MSPAVRRLSTDTGRGAVSLRRQSVDVRAAASGGRPSLDAGARAAMILTSAQSRLPNASKMENTYRTEPNLVFPTGSIKSIIKSVLDDALADKEYDPLESTALSSELSEAIKQKVKELGHPRYKIVVVVSTGPAVMSTMTLTSRCIWNPKIDTYSEYSFNNGKMYAIGLVYGIYYE